MKQVIRVHRFATKKREVLTQAITVVEEYQRNSIKLTLRQLYYQLVARGLIVNSQREYNKLCQLITDARYAGLVDWDAIEDRIRTPQLPQEWGGLAELLASAKQSYRLPRWDGQAHYVELITEKDALSSVLAPIAYKWGITFSVNRGYCSASAMYDLANRIIEHDGKSPVVLYLGDHDASGLDMVRDIQERLFEFIGEDVVVRPIALTAEQIVEYNPPPNPAKMADPRAKAYIEQHGGSSWEVDALPPDVLNRLVEDAIRSLVDLERMNAVISREIEDKAELDSLVAGVPP